MSKPPIKNNPLARIPVAGQPSIQEKIVARTLGEEVPTGKEPIEALPAPEEEQTEAPDVLISKHRNVDTSPHQDIDISPEALLKRSIEASAIKSGLVQQMTRLPEPLKDRLDAYWAQNRKQKVTLQGIMIASVELFLEMNEEGESKKD